MVKIPKGTKDVLPLESYKWQYIENIARNICNLYGAKEIRTPVFEHTELFDRSIGDDTDVVTKEMYTFLDKGNRSVTLKPEGTAGVMRSFIENNLSSYPMPQKLYYFTPVFRYERPQAGRLREHHQFGVEILGGDSACYDYELLNLAYTFLKNLNITGLSLKINNIGCPVCRQEYNNALKKYIEQNLSFLCSDCNERYFKNPLRILDCKNEGCKAIVKDAPFITDYLCKECRDHFDTLIKLLNNSSINYKIDPRIVRGLDYYTKTVFEFVTEHLGAQGTVIGGGRYDNLVESLGGTKTPCVGFGMGMERLLLLMEAMDNKIPDNTMINCFIACQDEKYRQNCIKVLEDLRNSGISCEADFTGRSLKAQFKFADKLKVRFITVLGEREIEQGLVQIKDMASGEKYDVKIDEIANKLKEKLY